MDLDSLSTFYRYGKLWSSCVRCSHWSVSSGVVVFVTLWSVSSGSPLDETYNMSQVQNKVNVGTIYDRVNN